MPGSTTCRSTRLRRNASDLCPVIQAHPNVKFILMHIGYPYQDEYIALAKHYPNVYIRSVLGLDH